MARKVRTHWSPTADEYAHVIAEQNPWRVDGSVPAALAPTSERPLAKFLWKRLLNDDPRRFQLVLGPRRVGKTTVLYQTVRHLLHQGIPAQRVICQRLDHPLLMRLSLGDLARLSIKLCDAKPDEPAYLILDEITYAADWDKWLKTFHDEQWPVRVAAASSSSVEITQARQESGVGRWEEQYLSPYLFPEFLSLIGRPSALTAAATTAATIQAALDSYRADRDLAELRRRFLLTGGFPELLAAMQNPSLDERERLLVSQRTLRGDAVERAIYRDIPQAFGVDRPLLLERVLYTLAGQITGILSPQQLCRDLDGLTQPTLDKYISYLQQAFLVFALQNYSGNETTKQKRGRKLYFVDSAVRNAALQRGLGPLTNPEEMGLLLENMAAGHLYALARQTQVRLYYWRDKQLEVDLVYDHPEHPLAFEIASSSTHSRQGLAAFCERYPRFRQRCFLVAPDVMPIQPSISDLGIGTLPIDLFLVAVGTQSERELAIRLNALLDLGP